MKKTVKVTAEDIRLGSQTIFNAKKCIIARALRRAGFKKVVCGYFDAKVEGERVLLPLSTKRVQDYYMAGEGRKPRPFSFQIEVGG